MAQTSPRDELPAPRASYPVMCSAHRARTPRSPRSSSATAGSRYEPGRRSGAWLKVKHTRRQELVIGAWLRGDIGRADRLGALLVGHRDEHGCLRYVGKVGLGYSDADRSELRSRLERIKLRVAVRRLDGVGHAPPPVLQGAARRRRARRRRARAQADRSRGRRPGPEAGFTEAQVLHYYARIAPTLLPHLHDRAMTLKRYPDGVARLRHATATVFDLGPGDGAGILDAAAIALPARHAAWRRPRERGQEHRLKGRPGLRAAHTPITFHRTKAFARDVAEVLAARLPDRVVARVDKRLRTGKVLVDWGQNDRHKSTVAPYSLRAKLARPTVALPIAWDALAAAADEGAADPLLPSRDQALNGSPNPVICAPPSSRSPSSSRYDLQYQPIYHGVEPDSAIQPTNSSAGRREATIRPSSICPRPARRFAWCCRARAPASPRPYP